MTLVARRTASNQLWCVRLRGAEEARGAVTKRSRPWRNGRHQFAAREGVQIGSKRVAGCVAPSRIFRKTPDDDVVEGLRQRAVEMRSRQRRRRKNAAADSLQGVGVEGALTGNHFIQNHAERENIGARVLGLADDLLGTPVSGSAEKGRISAVVAGEARHAKVGEFHAALFRNENGGGLYVPVDNSFAVGNGQGGRGSSGASTT